MTLEDKVIDIVREYVGQAEVSRHDTFKDDLHVDSLDVMEMTMRFEEEFQIEITDEDSDFKSVGEVIDYLKDKGM